MKTLAVSPRLCASTGRSSPAFLVKSRFSRGPSSLSFRSTRSRLPISKCSVVSTPSIVEDAVNFVEASKNGDLVPIFRCIFCDHLTPVLAYRCLVKEDDREAPSFLYESVEQGARGTNVGRYSIIGANPSIEVIAKGNSVTIMDHGKGTKTEEVVEDPMTVPRRIMEGWAPQVIDELRDVFCGRRIGLAA